MDFRVRICVVLILFFYGHAAIDAPNDVLTEDNDVPPPPITAIGDKPTLSNNYSGPVVVTPVIRLNTVTKKVVGAKDNEEKQTKDDSPSSDGAIKAVVIGANPSVIPKKEDNKVPEKAESTKSQTFSSSRQQKGNGPVQVQPVLREETSNDPIKIAVTISSGKPKIVESTLKLTEKQFETTQAVAETTAISMKENENGEEIEDDDKVVEQEERADEEFQNAEKETEKQETLVKESDKKQPEVVQKPVNNEFPGRVPVRTPQVRELIEDQSSDSHFMSFFLLFGTICVLGYVAAHNKKKILGLIFEGRTSSGRRGGRSSARYRRLSQNDDVDYRENVIY